LEDGYQLNKIEFHPSGSHLVAATGKGEVIFVDPSSFAIKHSLVVLFCFCLSNVLLKFFHFHFTVSFHQAHVAPCYSVDISACGRYIAYCNVYIKIFLIVFIDFVCRYMASSGGECLCGYWDLSEMACVQSFASREYAILKY
jgi:hypothetical protein